MSELTIKDLISKQQEEKYGPTADPTKFGETISDIDRVMSKDEKDYTIEDWGIINISVDPVCEHCMKGNKRCDKTAKFIIDDVKMIEPP